MKKFFSLVAVVLVIALALTGCGNAASNESGGTDSPSYPTKGITLICNFGAGGSSDLSVRALATAAEKYLSVPITVVNKSGGSGSVGATELANSSNDGYTIGLLSSNAVVLVPHQLDGITYTPDSFDYICTYGQYGYGFVVSAESDLYTIEDIIELAKNTKGGLGIAASGSQQVTAINDLAAAEGVELTHVPYTSGSEIITALLGGHVKVAVSGEAEATSFIESGEVRLIGSATDKRWAVSPDVPTIQEQGYDITLLGYAGIATPAGVDEETITILKDAFSKAVEDQDFIDVMNNLDFAVSYTTGEEFDSFMHEYYDIYKAQFSK